VKIALDVVVAAAAYQVMSVPLTLLQVESGSWMLIMQLKIPSFCNERYERLNEKRERKHTS
jgi:hypothetical protein